jgi:hypothetical protein
MADLTVENEADLHRIHDSVSAIPGTFLILGFLTDLVLKHFHLNNRKYLHTSLILDDYMRLSIMWNLINEFLKFGVDGHSIHGLHII